MFANGGFKGIEKLIMDVSKYYSECPSCHRPLSEEASVSLEKCKHMMHRSCYRNLSSQDPQAPCPTCGEKITDTHDVTSIEDGLRLIIKGTCEKFLMILNKHEHGSAEEKTQAENELSQFGELVYMLPSIASQMQAEAQQQGSSASAATSASASGANSGSAGSHLSHN